MFGYIIERLFFLDNPLTGGTKQKYQLFVWSAYSLHTIGMPNNMAFLFFCAAIVEGYLRMYCSIYVEPNSYLDLQFCNQNINNKLFQLMK